ncbi:hypothetical protein RQP46_006907 [Phenoliferia psychrophenolica]
MIPAITYSTSRLTFRTIEKGDVELVRGLYLDPLLSLQARGGLARLFICLPAKGSEVPSKVIGRITLLGSLPAHAADRAARFAIAIKPEHQGVGLGTEAMKWLLNWGFAFAGQHRIMGFVFGWNTEARKLYKKLGFCEEGVWKKHTFQGGVWHDVVTL